MSEYDDDLHWQLEDIAHAEEEGLMRAARNECDYECDECGTCYGGMPEVCPENDQDCTNKLKRIRERASK